MLRKGRSAAVTAPSRSAPDSWSGWREIAPAIRATLQAIPEPTESLPAEYYGDRLRRPCAAGYGTRGGTSRGKGSGSRYGSMVDCPEVVLVHVQIGLIAKPVRQRAAQLLEIMLEPCLLRRRLQNAEALHAARGCPYLPVARLPWVLVRITQGSYAPEPGQSRRILKDPHAWLRARYPDAETERTGQCVPELLVTCQPLPHRAGPERLAAGAVGQRAGPAANFSDFAGSGVDTPWAVQFRAVPDPAGFCLGMCLVRALSTALQEMTRKAPNRHPAPPRAVRGRPKSGCRIGDHGTRPDHPCTPGDGSPPTLSPRGRGRHRSGRSRDAA